MLNETFPLLPHLLLRHYRRMVLHCYGSSVNYTRLICCYFRSCKLLENDDHIRHPPPHTSETHTSDTHTHTHASDTHTSDTSSLRKPPSCWCSRWLSPRNFKTQGLKFLALTKLEYCSTVWGGLDKILVNKLQRAMNFAARVTFCACKEEWPHDPFSPTTKLAHRPKQTYPEHGLLYVEWRMARCLTWLQTSLLVRTRSAREILGSCRTSTFRCSYRRQVVGPSLTGERYYGEGYQMTLNCDQVCPALNGPTRGISSRSSILCENKSFNLLAVS